MSTAAPQVILRSDKKAVQPISVVAPRKAWKLLGWLGLMLAVVGLVDVGLQWYPTAFQSPEWEFGTISVSFASLPLLSIGTMALLASFLARGSKRGVIAMAFFFSLFTIGIVLGFLIFLTDLPLALRAAPGPSAMALKKSIVRTVIMGVSFGTGYLTAAVTSFRYLMRRTTDD